MDASLRHSVGESLWSALLKWLIVFWVMMIIMVFNHPTAVVSSKIHVGLWFAYHLMVTNIILGYFIPDPYGWIDFWVVILTFPPFIVAHLLLGIIMIGHAVTEFAQGEVISGYIFTILAVSMCLLWGRYLQLRWRNKRWYFWRKGE